MRDTLDRSATRSASLDGVAVHRGTVTRVTLSRCDGPLRVAQHGFEIAAAELAPVATDRGVTIASADGRVRVDVVEHLFAALGGLGVREGVRIEVVGDELPLLDGGAATYCAALRAIGAEGGAAPRLEVTRHATIGAGASTWALSPGPDVDVEVEVVFRPPVGRMRAGFTGDFKDFERRVAPARTFVWRDEIDALRARGRALGEVAGAAVVFDEAGPITGPLRGEDEPARHKLLDLVGDLALHGGPPRGRLRATRPGHTTTHALVAHALAVGILRVVAAVAALLLIGAVLAPRAAFAQGGLKDAPSPPTLQALVHDGLYANIGLTAATVDPGQTGGASPAGRAYGWFVHTELELPVIGRAWYVGAAEDVAGGAVPGVGSSVFFGSPEFWIRGIWVSKVGMSSGGGLAMVVPTPRDLSAPEQRVLDTIRVARPWDEVQFDPLTLTLRPYLDVRHVTGRVILQVRQGLDVALALSSPAALQRGAEFSAIGGFFVGVRATDWLGLGLELWETYAITAEIPDDERASFSLSPSVRLITSRFEPAFSVVFPISTPLRGAAQSYTALRLDMTLRFDGPHKP